MWVGRWVGGGRFLVFGFWGFFAKYFGGENRQLENVKKYKNCVVIQIVNCSFF